MKNIKFILVLLILCSCKSHNSTEISLSDKHIELKAKTVELKYNKNNFIPQSVYCNDDYFVIAQVHSSPCYYVFDYEGNLKASGLYLGRGPQDLIRPDLRFFSHTDNGFRVLDQGNIICDVVYDGNTLSITQRHKLQLDSPANFVVDVGNNHFCSLVGLDSNAENSDYEFCMTNIINKDNNKYFGTFPEQYTFADPGERLFKCLSVGVASPEQQKFAYFYRYIGQFKIYDSSTKLIKCVHIAGTKGLAIEDDTFNRTLYFGSTTANSKYIYTAYHNCEFKNVKDEKRTRVLKWSWDGELVEQYILDRHIDKISVSEKNQLIGINTSEDSANIYVYDIS